MADIDTDSVIQKLREVIDPHTGTNVYDMGLIQDLVVDGDGISLRFTLTSSFCPIGMQLGVALKRKLRELPVERIDVKIDNYLRSSELEAVLAEL